MRFVRYMPGICFVGILAMGCNSTQPRITSVMGHQIKQTVSEADERVFLASRAAGYRVTSRPLPISEQRQEFLIHWAGDAVDAVRLEYRQSGLPNQLQQQTARVSAAKSHTFTIDGDAFQSGGYITAWRVTLLQKEQPVAQQQSALWQ